MVSEYYTHTLIKIILYFVILSIGGQVAALSSVGAMLLGVIITGLFNCFSIFIKIHIFRYLKFRIISFLSSFNFKDIG